MKMVAGSDKFVGNEFGRRSRPEGERQGSRESIELSSSMPADDCDVITGNFESETVSMKMVARDRIELPTRGFSVPCSTN